MPTYVAIKKQIAELEKKAADVRKAEIAKVIVSMKRQIAEYDLTAADLGLAGAGKAAVKKKAPASKRPKLPAKYMDPKTQKTWNGHGKPPLWIAAATKRGRRDDYLIERVMAAAATKVAPKAPAAAPTTQPKKAAATKATAIRRRAVASAPAKAAAVKAVSKKPASKAVKKPTVGEVPAATATVAEPVATRRAE